MFVAYKLPTMSDLAQNPDRDDILAELQRVLGSRYFKSKKRSRQILDHAVKRTLDGKKVDEYTLADDVFEIKDFDRTTTSTVRVAILTLRDQLSEYYAEEGVQNPWRIELPTYVPEFKKVVPREAPAPWWKKKAVVGFVILATFLPIVLVLWSLPGKSATVGEEVTITSPKDGDAVTQFPTVRGTKKPHSWLRDLFDTSKDYLMVEVIKYHQWYMQDPLGVGPSWSLTAQCGDDKTDPGTEFRLFVLRTTETLKRGAITQTPALTENSQQYSSVRVTRK